VSYIDGATALGVDSSRGIVYVTGSTMTNNTGQGLPNYLTLAYSCAGVPLWTNGYISPYGLGGSASALAVDTNSGNVYVTGSSATSEYSSDFATLAYSSTGTPLWTNRWNTTGTNGGSANAIAVDSSGNVIVAGWVFVGIWGGPREYAVIAYSATGTPLWTNLYRGPIGGDNQIPSAGCLAVGPNGAVYVTGTSDGANGGTTNSDFATIKYLPSPDILFSAINRLPNSASLLSITAPTNVAYRLEASPDLANWLPLTNFPPLPATSLQYTDTLAPSFPTRFYRTVWSP
jgi:hypothetical protein